MPRLSAARRAVALLVAVLALSSCDLTGGVRRYLSGWAPYWTPTGSTETYTQNADVMETLSPFWYSAQGDPGTIVAHASTASMAAMVNAARADGVPVLPSITDGNGPRVMAGILADPASRAEHVRAIVDLVLANGYDGIDLDYESFAFADGTSSWPTTKPAWIAFVRELGAALHAEDKLLAVTVPPIWADGTRGYTVYAWKEIGPSVDRLRTMNYDWSWSSAGPGSPIWWVLDTIDYARSVVPISKVEIGVPAYGREWTVSARGTCPSDQVPGTVSHTLDDIPALIAATRATPTRDAASGEMTFRYRRIIQTRPSTGVRTHRALTQREMVTALSTIDGPVRPHTRPTRLSQCRLVREVWYPDATAIGQRALAATDAGAGVTMWAFGYETPDVWTTWHQVGGTLSGPAGTAPVGDLETAVPTARRIAVSGWAFDPEGDLPITVTLTARPVGDPGAPPTAAMTVLARDGRADVATAHPGAGEFHGFTAQLRLGRGPAGDYAVCATARGRYAAPATTDLGCLTVRVEAS